jgi:hypothetical protein
MTSPTPLVFLYHLPLIDLNHKLNTVYTDSVCGCGGGAVKMGCRPYSAGVLHSVSDQRTYKIASPPQTKMTSKDVIKGFVSLNFIRPWIEPRTVVTLTLAVRSSALAVR